jgi:nicotinate-nucleotide adenylyltransferase
MAGMNRDADPHTKQGTGRSTIQRLGVLGGTFDPIHHGHLVAAQEACYQLALDRLLFVPAGSPPHKPAGPLTHARHRLRMIELAIADRPSFDLSRVDVARPGPQYTADMLQLLREEWGPETTLFFVEGADSLAQILDWHDPQRIVELAEIAVVDRRGVELDVDLLEQHLPGLTARLHRVQMPLLDISSTDLRQRVREGRPIDYLLPHRVRDYILEHDLYLEVYHYEDE